MIQLLTFEKIASERPQTTHVGTAMSNCLPHLMLEERHRVHLEEVEDFNDYRHRTIEYLNQQSYVLDLLVSKRYQHTESIRRSILSGE
jgi:hypothetical protein